jgi:heptosyltransferase II
MKIVVLAPNWLGDAVLALPAIAAVRRAYPEAHLAVAARRSVADVFRLAPNLDEVLTLQADARWWRPAPRRADAAALRGFDAALLLPNSFQAAWLAKRAGIPERWGYATDARSRLLTRPVLRTRGGHQAEYYTRLVAALGMAVDAAAPALDVPAPVRQTVLDLLSGEGHPPGAPLVVLAPGAAYGKAKQWTPAHVAALASRLGRERAVSCVLVGSRGDAATSHEIRRMAGVPDPGRLIDLTGRTSLEMLAGVLAAAGACVSNDSGAMHLAAAVGTSVVATFGPTNEQATRPLAREGRRAEVITHAVWCRPCMLRECPIDHRCMTGISPDRVFAAVAEMLANRVGSALADPTKQRWLVGSPSDPTGEGGR